MQPFYYSLLLLSMAERDSKRTHESLKDLKVRDLRRHCGCHHHEESAEVVFPNTESLIPLLKDIYMYIYIHIHTYMHISTFPFYR